MADCDCTAASVVTCGHRGAGANNAGALYPENTLASFAGAAEQGATRVELDVALSSDGEVVLMHDATVDATTNGSGCVADFTAAELGALDPPVPTLAEVVAAVDIDLNVEIKVDDDEGCPATDIPALVDATLAVLATDTKDREIRVSSFSTEVLDRVRTVDPERYVGLISQSGSDVAVAADAGYDGIHLLFSQALVEPHVADAKAAGLYVSVWTVNVPEAVPTLIDLGVDAIITDDIPMVEAAKQAHCAAECGGVDEPPVDEDGCGCTSAAGAAAAWPALLALVGWGRRRRYRVDTAD